MVINKHRTGRRAIAVLVSFALLTVACSGDDDDQADDGAPATTTEASTTEEEPNPTEDSSADLVSDDETAETVSATEIAFADVPEGDGLSLWLGVMSIATGDEAPTPIAAVETVVDFDEQTFSKTMELQEEVVTIVGTSTSQYVGVSGNDTWLRTDLGRSRYGTSPLDVGINAADGTWSGDATLDGDSMDVVGALEIFSATDEDGAAAGVTAVLHEAWYSEAGVQRFITVTVTFPIGDEPLKVIEVMDRVEASGELASPRVPATSVPIEAAIAAAKEQESAAGPTGFRSVLHRPAQASGVFACDEVRVLAVYYCGYDGEPKVRIQANDNPCSSDHRCGRTREEIRQYNEQLVGNAQQFATSSGLTIAVMGLAGLSFVLPSGTMLAILVGAIGSGLAVGLALGFLIVWLWALTHGEPHITTVNGVGYNFQSGGEFVYFWRPDFEVQSRFLGEPGTATSSQATAVRLGNHVIEVYFDVTKDVNEAGVPVTIDGVTQRLGVEGVWFEDGSFVANEPGGQDRTIIAVSANGDMIRIENLTVSQNIELAVRASDDVPGVGLAGTANADRDDDFTTRNGDVVSATDIRTIEGLYLRFGESWRVTPEERLFTDSPAETYLTDEFLVIPDEYPSLAQFDPDERAAAEDECREAGVPDGRLLEDCAYDLLAAPDQDWAQQASEGSATARRSDTNPRPSASLAQTPDETEPDAPIIIAAAQCSLSEVEALLAESSSAANVRTNDDGWTPLMFAAQDGCADVAAVLVEAGADIDHAADEGVYAAYLAAQNGHQEMLDLLLEAGSRFQRSIDGGETPLLAAAYFGNPLAVNALLQRGADPNVGRRSDQFTPLIAAVQQGHADIAQSLIDSGAELERTNDEGSSALTVAAYAGRIDVVDLLLRAGADVTANNVDGISPLLASIRNDDVALVDRLLAAGAPVDHADAGGYTALHRAAQNADVAIIARLIEAGASPDARNEDGETSLISPSARGDAETVTALLDGGADPNVARNDGITPLHFAAQEANDAIAQLLLQAGADVNATDDAGATPLHLAAAFGLGSTVQLLVSSGADCDATNDRGLTPTDIAAEANLVPLAACA